VITTLIKRIACRLDKSKIPYMIIGGQAVLLYGTPRLTRAIDITLGVDTDQWPLMDKICRDLGLRMLPDEPKGFAEQTKVLPAEDPGSRIWVDFIFSFTPYEAQAINRAKEVSMEGYPVKFASCEDVIIHKMIAARAVDLEDVRHMLTKNRERIDLDYLRRTLGEFSNLPEHQRILEDFEDLLRR